MFRVCSLCCTHVQLMQFPWMSWQYLLHPTPREITLASLKGEKKIPPRIQQRSSSLTMYFLMTCWGLMRLLTQFLRNKNWQTSLERARDSALTEQHQTAEQCLLFWQLTWCCELFPHAGAKRGLRQRGPNGTRRSCYLLPWKAILNNLSGIRKVTFWSKWSHHLQQFFPTSTKERNMCSWSLCHH